MPLQVYGLHWWVSEQAGDPQSLLLVLALPSWFCYFSGLGTEIQVRSGCYLQEGQAREGEITHGVRFCFPILPTARHSEPSTKVNISTRLPIAGSLCSAVSAFLFHLSWNFLSVLLSCYSWTSAIMSSWSFSSIITSPGLQTVSGRFIVLVHGIPWTIEQGIYNQNVFWTPIPDIT